jgi:hypothetical protein
MAKKLLLVILNTDRKIDGEMRRVKFKPKTVVDLTDDEIATLDNLEKATGVAHYREPTREGVEDAAPEVVELPDYAGQDTPIAEKNVEQLKAYLDFFEIAYKGNDSKATLTAAAEKHAAGDNADDKDGGL